MLIILGVGALESITFIFLPILLNIILSFGGTYINLLLPKLEWDSESQVVKQSLSLVVTMIAGYIIAFVPTVLDLLGVSFTLSAIVSIGLYISLAIVTVSLLFTHGVKKFNKLLC